MNEQACILWKKRRTVGWLNLSLAARGAAEGIVVALDERGELRLGRYGLQGLAGLLGRPWAECEPAVLELLEAGRFVIDEARAVLLDPKYPARSRVEDVLEDVRRLEIAMDERPAPPASGTVLSDDAVRARRRRDRIRASQLELELRPVATAVAAPAVPESAAPMPTSAPTMNRSVRGAPNSPSLSDLKISKKRERGAATSSDVVQPRAPIPDACRAAFAEACATANALLCVDFVWKKFADHAHRKRWRVSDLSDRWASWFDREIKYTHDRAVQLRARDRPGLALATAPLFAERRQWELEAASGPEALAAAARAMAVFA